jgi:hypothetical protein
VLRSIARLIRLRTAQQGIKEAEQGLTQVNTWREEIARLRAAADATEQSISGTQVPSPAQIDGIKELDHQLKIARARLNVGLHLKFQPKQDLTLFVRRDEEERIEHALRGATFETSANRQITLDIEGLAEITLSGGERDARKEAEALQKRWVDEVEPILQRAGVLALDDLARIAAEIVKRSQEVRDARRTVDQLEQRVSDQHDWGALRATHERDFKAAADALGEEDHDRLDATARALSIDDLSACDARLNILRADQVRLVETKRKLGDLAAARATGVEKQKAVDEAREALQRLQSLIDGDWRDLQPRAQDKQSMLKIDLRRIERELEALSAENDNTLSDAQKRQATAEERLAAVETDLSGVQKRLREAEWLTATNDGKLKMQREIAAKLDLSAAREAVEKIKAELNQVPPPPYAITDEMLSDARESVQSARDHLKEIEYDIQAKRGALEHVGGEVAKQRAEDAHEALSRAREQEEAMENKYASLDLLRNTLREAEQEEGVHLGRALGDPIAQRFGALTNRRYGRLALGPNLETQSISAVGDGRSVSSLSVGTRDQLSTIFRLSLAEQLQSAILLDDQLTQSDAQRMTWLRDLIRQLASTIQILIFTCRPSDYLLAAELKPGKKSESSRFFVRSIDLAEIIDRSSESSSVRDVDHSQQNVSK